MEVMFTLCNWCERSAHEIRQEDGIDGPEEALLEVVVNNKRIRLCRRCLKRFAPNAVTDPEQVRVAVVDFPPGITSIDHYCSTLLAQGKPEEECELEVIMRREGAYYIGRCPYCGIQARSLADKNAF